VSDGREGERRHRLAFVFVDGVGLAPAGPRNPLSQVLMPRLHALLGGPLVPETLGQDGGLTFRAVDACLGVGGLPGSATGQTALFTGVNAAAVVGEHVPDYPTSALRAVIAEHSILKQAADGGARVSLANAYSERYWALVRDEPRRLSASTLTMMACGAPFRTLADLLAGQAVMWDLTNEVAVSYFHYELPLVAPEEGGRRLARLAAGHDLLLFETFLTDLAGHNRIEPEWVLVRLDAFLGGILDECQVDTTLVVCSDHGNLEDSTTRIHTTNPVPLLAVGPAAGYFGEAERITDVAPAILSALAGGRPGEGNGHGPAA
jgi:hypothetical protein